jgi:hypothetical protein
MMFMPVPGNINPATEPDFLVLLHVLKESLQRGDTGRTTGQPAV